MTIEGLFIFKQYGTDLCTDCSQQEREPYDFCPLGDVNNSFRCFWICHTECSTTNIQRGLETRDALNILKCTEKSHTTLMHK